MSFAIFKERTLRRLIRDFSTSNALVALVGAGASVESGLPSWKELVEAALLRAASDAGFSLTDDEKASWVSDTIRRDDLLGAMAIADALIKEPISSWLPDILYSGKGADAYQPGPISRQVANLRAAFGDHLDIATTNYDDLLEVALERHRDIKVPIVPFTGDQSKRPRTEHVAVAHPHGYYGRTGHHGQTILTLEQYHRSQRGSSWQETHLGEKIMEKDCLFVGMSMTDSNILRYLDFYAQRKQRHAALIVRQRQPDATLALQSAHEVSIAARWAKRGVKAVFLDHYADIAYVLHEIAYCREVGRNSYKPLDVRCAKWISSVERLLIAPGNPGRFRKGQEAMNDVLRETLGAALNAVAESGVDITRDKLAMSLWLLSRDGTRLTCWSSTDRLQIDSDTIVPVPLDEESKWIAVSAVCKGTQVVGVPGGATPTSTSRWGYIVGLPLHVKPPNDGILPIGCLTIASMQSREDTILTNMPEDVQASVNSSIRKAIANFLMEASKP